MQLHASEALYKLLNEYEFQTVLDIGSGQGFHAEEFKRHGKEVTTISLGPADIVADYNIHDFGVKFGCLWASHVLEHQPNVNSFLKKCFNDLDEGGVFAVTVPPLKHEIVGGHVSLWNEGLLLYNLILAGFDCSRAKVKRYGYNISCMVQKVPATLPELDCDSGDIRKLSKFFPMPVDEAFNGQIGQVNW